MRLRAALTLAWPVVAAWAHWQARRTLRAGAPLSAQEQAVACALGVRRPQQIRVQRLPRLPLPGLRWWAPLARRLGWPGADIAGLALGHAVLLRDDAVSPQLLAHELRHVQQCEQAGSLGTFLRQYLSQVACHGYRDAPLEVDARLAAGTAIARMGQTESRIEGEARCNRSAM